MRSILRPKKCFWRRCKQKVIWHTQSFHCGSVLKAISVTNGQGRKAQMLQKRKFQALCICTIREKKFAIMLPDLHLMVSKRNLLWFAPWWTCETIHKLETGPRLLALWVTSYKIWWDWFENWPVARTNNTSKRSLSYLICQFVNLTNWKPFSKSQPLPAPSLSKLTKS